LVSTAWPPFTNPPGRPRFALDLIEAALGRAGISTTTSIVDAAAFTPGLLNEQFDGSGAVWKDADRERVLLFSQAYLENRLVLVGRKGASVSAATLSALKGKRIAIVEGYSYGDIETSGPIFVRSQSEEDSLSRLLDSKVDYTLMDELVVQYIVEHYAKEAQTRLEIGSTPLVTRELFLAVRRSRPDAASIISRFNAQLRGMIADRTYHRLLHVRWIRADIDGDGVPENVPIDDNAGPQAPQRVYTLPLIDTNSTSSLSKTVPVSPRFYLGGSIYTDWASVPDKFKMTNPEAPPDPRGSTGTVFNFSW
jgi:polar amino acid transport system substrate-binding protein